MVVCCACGLEKGKRAFPKTQWKTRTKRCKECITSRRHVVTAYCCACGDKKKIEAFPESRWGLPREEWRCNECIAGNVPIQPQWNVYELPWESLVQESLGMTPIVPVHRNGITSTNTIFYVRGTEDTRGALPSDDFWGQMSAPQGRATSVTPTKQDGISSPTSGSPSSVVQDPQDRTNAPGIEHWGQAPPQGSASVTAMTIERTGDDDDDEPMDGSKPRLDELREKVKVSFDDSGKVFFTVG